MREKSTVNSKNIMSKKKDIWNQITKTLQPKLKKSEFNTWFSRARLQQLDPDLAIIAVPNKFVADWLQERYLPVLEKTFKRVLKHSPTIHFNFENPQSDSPVTTGSRNTDVQPVRGHNLNPAMTFKDFIIWDSNRFASSSAFEVANRPGSQYNPLYIYCSTGLGKTHLLHALGNHVLQENPLARIGFYTSETFTSEFTHSLKNGRLQELRDKCCKLDLFLFDDIQMLAHRKRTQDEFLFIFNSLYSAKAQIVVTGDRPPSELGKINIELKSRLGWGLLTEILPPELELKLAIVRRHADEDGLKIPDDVLFYLANSSPDIKNLLINIIKTSTYSSIHNNGLSISMVKSLTTRKHRGEITVDDIKKVTAGYFNISLSDLVSSKKKRVFSYPRQLAMYLTRKHTSLSYKEIGKALGPKDHSTVIYAVRRVEKQKDRNKPIKDDIKKIEDMLG
jgi:chromosomal replication initiator protein